MLNRKWLSTALLALIAAISPAQAGSQSKPMIELGAGMESAVTSGGLNILMRVGFAWVETDEDLPGDPHEPEQLIWARISADLAIAATSQEDGILPYMDIEFIPVESRNCVHCEDGDNLSVMGGLQGLPMSLRRDVRLDERAMFQIDIVGVAFQANWKQTENLALIARVAAEALGYKLAVHAENSNFHGFHLAEIGMEAGLLIPVDQNLKIRVVLGGEVDLAIGGSSGFGVYSDMNAYLAAQAEIFRNLSIFTRGGVGMAIDSANGSSEGVLQLLFGVSYRF